MSSFFRALLTGEPASGEALSYTRFAEGSYESYFFAFAFFTADFGKGTRMKEELRSKIMKSSLALGW